MRFVTTAAALTLAALLALAAPAASTNRPTLTAAGVSNGHVWARWTLPAGLEANLIEVSTSRKLIADGYFRDAVETRLLNPRQTSWRSPGRLQPYTYYVHVNALDEDLNDRWSNVRTVKVGGGAAPVVAGRFAGTTSQGQRFELTTDGARKFVTHLRYTLRLRCGGGSRMVTYDVGAHLFVATVGTFGGEFVWPPGTKLSGSFHGSTATGTVRQSYFDGNAKAQCESGTVQWTAKRVS